MSRNVVKDCLDFDRKNILEYFKLIFNGKTTKGLSNQMVDYYFDLRYYNILDRML